MYNCSTSRYGVSSKLQADNRPTFIKIKSNHETISISLNFRYSFGVIYLARANDADANGADGAQRMEEQLRGGGGGGPQPTHRSRPDPPVISQMRCHSDVFRITSQQPSTLGFQSGALTRSLFTTVTCWSSNLQSVSPTSCHQLS